MEPCQVMSQSGVLSIHPCRIDITNNIARFSSTHRLTELMP